MMKDRDEDDKITVVSRKSKKKSSKKLIVSVGDSTGKSSRNKHNSKTKIEAKQEAMTP